MSMQTSLTTRWQIRHPIIQAPMTGGGDTPALVAAVSEAGGLGFIGAAALSPAQIADVSRDVRQRTTRPFGINLFAPHPLPQMPADPAPALTRVAGYFAELGLQAPGVPDAPAYDFGDQLAVALESGASMFSFTMGLLSPDDIDRIKSRGLFVMGTATTVDEALALERTGVDAVIAQGWEAGGHRGTFAGPVEAAMIGTLALVPQVVDAVHLPVIAAGAVMDGRGIVAALALGASAVQMGTAFLTCDEAGVPESYKAAILAAREDETRVTRAFSGREARGIVNRFMREVDRADGSDAILPFPLQNALTRPMRAAATKQNRPEFLSLWAGQGVRMSRRQSAAALVARLVEEADRVIRAFGPVSHGAAAGSSGA